jgi:cytochrome c oxidase subunit II
MRLLDPVPESGWGLPHDASRDGHNIDWLLNATTFFITLLFAIMCIWMVWAVVKHNREHKAEYDHGDSKRHVFVAMLISAVIFFIVDGNLWFNATVDINSIYWNFEVGEKHPEAVRIEVNAHQWAWDTRYAGPDQKFNTADDVVTLNDIRVPQGVPILFQLASTDVIHSFYLPNMRVKQDAMPGMITRLWFVPKDTGEYDIGCAQHCGVNHYKMKAKLTVLTMDEYKRWLDGMSQIAVRKFDPNDHEALWGWEWKRPGETVARSY